MQFSFWGFWVFNRQMADANLIPWLGVEYYWIGIRFVDEIFI